jgi:pentafunctional AROM polypeptide
VDQDERESGLRGLLNFGHSIGHAIEAILAPALLHGEAVSVGMVLEAEVARHLGYFNHASLARLVRCLKSYGLPTSDSCSTIRQAMQQMGVHYLHLNQLMDIMRVDKKNIGAKKRLVLLSKIGGTLEEHASFVDDKVIELVLAPAVLVKPPSVWPKNVKLCVPGSKSISNRALLLAALGEGECEIRGLLHSDDTQVRTRSFICIYYCFDKAFD